MSKQSEAKEAQNYIAKPKPPMCSNCVHYKSEMVENEYHYIQEKNMRCGRGGFAIKKTSNCAIHVFDTDDGKP